MKRLFLATLGYDEKFVIRSLIRNGLSAGDSILLFAPKDYLQDDKAVKAIEIIKGMVSRIVPDIELRIEEYDLFRDFPEEVSRIRNVIKGYEFDEIVACLSGGMRALIFSILFTLLTFSGNLKIIVEIEFENLEHYIRVPLSILKTPYSNRWVMILDFLSRSMSLRKISQITGLSLATVSRIVKDIRSFGLINEENVITEEGIFYLKMYKNMFQ
ncbi:MAG: CRISPR-associated CARF protein Csa3 [bacterium]|nr:CRISPR-associated CARF protein Csa3 [bacterium]MDW7986987.1 CRISPR-associated CARF protein Csa3 [Nitrososphaerota archaeon]